MVGNGGNNMDRRSRPSWGKVLYEQYLDQANGYRLSMLSIDDAPDESESDEDEELEESWTPTFRK
jgi:hypothetical protein